MLTLLAMTVAKCTLVCFYLRITPNKIHRTAAWVLMGLNCATGIAWVGILAGRCAGSRASWGVLDGQCPGYVRTLSSAVSSGADQHQTAGWSATAATDVALEVLIFLMPVWIVWDLQMAVQMKTIIILTFAVRLPIIAVSLVHLRLAGRWNDLSEGKVAAVIPCVCLLVELHFSTMSSTFPTLGPFMKSLNTRWGAIDPQTASSYALESLSGREGTQKSLASYSKNTGYYYRVKGDPGRRASRDSNSNDSSRMIIHRTTETTVEYDRSVRNASQM
ncbi:uncharacterized protein LTR77_009336 [Saxophila tyrrhenica]|uniref:Rhodopsin domain-containing protein n=1 Tax=Saxophila tyrrhenica TaxID=1690608 RepID=A0AAV9NZJ7_9PEZI|nr:hypothetical protein LTR77_009336 [Saxophila tyrrhenica]